MQKGPNLSKSISHQECANKANIENLKNEKVLWAPRGSRVEPKRSRTESTSISKHNDRGKDATNTNSRDTCWSHFGSRIMKQFNPQSILKTKANSNRTGNNQASNMEPKSIRKSIRNQNPKHGIEQKAANFEDFCFSERPEQVNLL